MLRFVYSLLLISFSTSSFCQILNIEKFRVDKDTVNAWAGTVGFGFSTQKQQTSVTTLNANSNVVYLSEKHSYININYIKFIGVEASDVLSEGYTHWRVNFYRKKKLSYEPFLQVQYDLNRGLERRELAGFSFRYHLLQSNKVLFTFNTGAMYEHEIWRGLVLRFPKDHRTDLAETYFIKSTSNLSLRGDITPRINLLLTTYYQARFDRFFAPRVISEIQLNFPITRHFSISNQFTSTVDAAPILNDNNFIYSYTTNLILKF